MDKQWNSQDGQELEALREESRRRIANEEEKRWREIPFPLTLQDALTRLTKNELSAIRSNLHVRKASSLNKGDLTDLLCQVIPSLAHSMLQQLDEERYGVLKRIADGGGQALVPLEPYQYEYFQLRGLAFTGTVNGKRTVVLPQEVLKAFAVADGPSLRAMAKSHSEWIQLSQGLLFYYGYLSTGDIVRMVEEYSGGRVDTYKYLSVLFEAFDYGCPIRAYFNGFTNDDVIDIRRVVREHESRPDVPFYHFTKAQLLRAGKPGYVDRNPAYKAFVDFLKRSYDVTSGEAEEEAEFCVYEIQNGDSLGDIIQDITEEFEIPTLDVLQALSHHLSELHNNTRQWFLKGHTPKELLPADLAAMRPLPNSTGAKGQIIDMTTKKKIGRNDPCPCGSGKKYKKCCGR